MVTTRGFQSRPTRGTTARLGRFGVGEGGDEVARSGGVTLRVQRHEAHSFPGILATIRSEVVNSSICSQGLIHAMAL